MQIGEKAAHCERTFLAAAFLGAAFLAAGFLAAAFLGAAFYLWEIAEKIEK
jgi:hypothetical protein